MKLKIIYLIIFLKGYGLIEACEKEINPDKVEQAYRGWRYQLCKQAELEKIKKKYSSDSFSRESDFIEKKFFIDYSLALKGYYMQWVDLTEAEAKRLNMKINWALKKETYFELTRQE